MSGRRVDVLRRLRKYPDGNAFVSKADTIANDVHAQGGPGALPRRARLLAVKDNIATGQHPTTCGSDILKQHRSPYEASIVTLLREQGAVVVGKTNLDEFGMGSHSTNSFFGPVQNPYTGGRHSVGGSSGGSAIAVKTMQAQVALGTDTGGSVRLPAAYTGTVGFKPSYGLIPRRGVIPYANSLDTVGILASNAAVAGEVFHPARKHDPLDPTSITESCWQRMEHDRDQFILESGRPFNFKKQFPTLKIGIPIEYNIAELHPGIREVWQNVLEALQKRGCTVIPISLPNTKHALSAYYVLAAAEAASNLSKYDGVRYGTRGSDSDGAGDVLYSLTRGKGFGDEVKRRILLGSYTLSSAAIDNYFIKAQKVRRLVQRDFDRVFALPNFLRPAEQFDLSALEESIAIENKRGPPQVDFIICPTAPTPPPTFESIAQQTSVDAYMNDVFTVPASLAGLPSISIPFRIPDKYEESPASNFAGIQIIGQYSDDFRVLSAAIEVQTPGFQHLVNSSLRSKTTQVANSITFRTVQTTGPLLRQASSTLPLIRKVATTQKEPENFQYVSGNENSSSPREENLSIVKKVPSYSPLIKKHLLSFRLKKFFTSSPLVIRKYNVPRLIRKPRNRSEINIPSRTEEVDDFSTTLGNWPIPSVLEGNTGLVENVLTTPKLIRKHIYVDIDGADPLLTEKEVEEEFMKAFETWERTLVPKSLK